jgi:hypothetical protein
MIVPTSSCAYPPEVSTPFVPAADGHRDSPRIDSIGASSTPTRPVDAALAFDRDVTSSSIQQRLTRRPVTGRAMPLSELTLNHATRRRGRRFRSRTGRTLGREMCRRLSITEPLMLFERNRWPGQSDRGVARSAHSARSGEIVANCVHRRCDRHRRAWATGVARLNSVLTSVRLALRPSSLGLGN